MSYFPLTVENMKNRKHKNSFCKIIYISENFPIREEMLRGLSATESSGLEEISLRLSLVILTGSVKQVVH